MVAAYVGNVRIACNSISVGKTIKGRGLHFPLKQMNRTYVPTVRPMYMSFAYEWIRIISYIYIQWFTAAVPPPPLFTSDCQKSWLQFRAVQLLNNPLTCPPSPPPSPPYCFCVEAVLITWDCAPVECWGGPKISPSLVLVESEMQTEQQPLLRKLTLFFSTRNIIWAHPWYNLIEGM